MFQQQIIAVATKWMCSQQMYFLQLVHNQRLVIKRLRALERALKKGDQIDAEDDVVMALALPILKEPQVHFPHIVIQYICNLAYRDMLTETGLVLATGQKEEAVCMAHPSAQQVTLALATASKKY